jgi:hypothetical protein
MGYQLSNCKYVWCFFATAGTNQITIFRIHISLCSIHPKIIYLLTPSCGSLHHTGMWRAIYPAVSKVVCRRDLGMWKGDHSFVCFQNTSVSSWTFLSALLVPSRWWGQSVCQSPGLKSRRDANLIGWQHSYIIVHNDIQRSGVATPSIGRALDNYLERSRTIERILHCSSCDTGVLDISAWKFREQIQAKRLWAQ